ncbi:MAG: dihydroneopterin triphosphate diphosphatase [Betaproteobacteria bacterium]|nr:dihydroneopterin triphosphate diphosphatase [Betaproteobacteria bacterium]
MFKIPKSVLVVIYTPELDVLLIRRADAEADYWQSVTGSKDYARETFRHTAQREVWEETGIDCRTGTLLASCLTDWYLENVYDIYPAWLSRYAPGVTRNTEHVFGLCVPRDTPVRLSPREHTHAQWLPYLAAADMVGSYSNAEACLMLPRLPSAQALEFASKLGASLTHPRS